MTAGAGAQQATGALLGRLLAGVEHSLHSGALQRLIASPAFWPVAVKGGFEHTLRDLLLHELDQAMRPLGLRCIGERTWGDAAARADLLVVEGVMTDERIRHPRAVIELKVNFDAQGTTGRRRSVDAWWRHHAGHTQDAPPPLLVLHFVHLFLAADAADCVLLERYRAAPRWPKAMTDLDRLDACFEALVDELEGPNLPAVRPVGKPMLFEPHDGSGCGLMAAVALLPRQAP